MCKRDIESAKVTPESVLSNTNRGNLEGTHLTRFSPGGGYLGFISRGVISVHRDTDILYRKPRSDEII